MDTGLYLTSSQIYLHAINPTEEWTAQLERKKEVDEVSDSKNSDTWDSEIRNSQYLSGKENWPSTYS